MSFLLQCMRTARPGRKLAESPALTGESRSRAEFRSRPAQDHLKVHETKPVDLESLH